MIICVIILIGGILCHTTVEEAKANVATNNISIRVGYNGMDLSEYIETANFRELKLWIWDMLKKHIHIEKISR